MDENTINSIMQTFKFDCVGENSCTLSDLASLFPEVCLQKFPEIKDLTDAD